MEDRLTRGFVAGVIGGIATNAFSFLAGAMGWTTVRTADLIALIVYAHEPPFTPGELTFAVLGHIMVSGVLGIAFAHLVLKISMDNLWLKGMVVSTAAWYLVYSITTLFEVPGTVPTPLSTAVTDGVSALILGLGLVIALQALTPAGESVRVKASAIPAMKPLDYDDDESHG